MTGIYKAIEQRLWKKDAVRLDKMSEGDALSARPAEIERSVQTEIALVECFAFNGLHSDVIDFTPGHRDKIVNLFPLSDLTLDETLARLSFLRTSDPSKIEGRNYHFIHLTFHALQSGSRGGIFTTRGGTILFHVLLWYALIRVN
ncbi:hypothetical protein BGZ61DRAFT_545795 [Ilyonectria robusta]|uniref:uncharacterized protein n=1 Tax=Ilyonectria robusta TaxID=1079257 RepID=UPI001E8D4390|nr:uncharacterized protein BGZ61DRAFT_545795 [Ilyonectria robusta]KAH8650432.1 hypothetical protein BGZ61DRAFT_545795 [Ilyonectria robusta]